MVKYRSSKSRITTTIKSNQCKTINHNTWTKIEHLYKTLKFIAFYIHDNGDKDQQKGKKNLLFRKSYHHESFCGELLKKTN